METGQHARGRGKAKGDAVYKDHCQRKPKLTNVKQYETWQLHKVGNLTGETRRMSEENGLITHSTTSPHQENQTATENNAMVITSPDLVLCTLEGN